MMDITVIAESTPGPIAIKCATFVGYKIAGLHLIVTNCVTMKGNFVVDGKAFCILLILLGVMFGYQKITKKKLSPIMRIVVSAAVGIGVGVIGF